MFQHPELFYRLKNVTLIEGNPMPLQKIKLFLLKGFSAMMRRLISDVVGYPAQMRMRNGKRAEAFLPRKPASDPLLLVNVISRSCFDLADQI